MIKVSLNNGVPLIYNADDWFLLRTRYRIVGEIFGSTRTSSIALPVALCPEEALMLIKKGIITLCRWNKINKTPSNEDILKYMKELKRIHKEQRILLRDERKTQLENHVDNIIKGRKDKDTRNISRDDIILEELNKIPKLEEENIINPIFTQHPDYLRGDVTNVSESELLAYTSENKYLVYEDLWEKGYYITCGRKFGGDFLVYFGDPVSFHAVYIVKCVQDVRQLQTITEFVAYGRLGNAVKKKFVLAAVENNKLSYLSLSWIDTEFN